MLGLVLASLTLLLPDALAEAAAAAAAVVCRMNIVAHFQGFKHLLSRACHQICQGCSDIRLLHERPTCVRM